ncbi:MAG TPA: hypothetical protein VK470_02115 [Bacteroidota bacterium]|nr:hypothetical protein [Bacteroidota bacterium]
MRSSVSRLILIHFTLAWLMAGVSAAQEDPLKTAIKEKILLEDTYTNVWFVDQLDAAKLPAALQNRPMWKCIAPHQKMKAGAVYTIYFTMDPSGANVIPLLVSEEITLASATDGSLMFKGSMRGSASVQKNYYNTFSDLSYKDLQQFLRDEVPHEKYKTLRAAEKHSVIYTRADQTNQDQLEYLRTNSNHSIARISAPIEGADQPAVTNSYLDLSMTHAPILLTSLSFSQTSISWKALGLKGIGFEVAQSEDRILNLLPIQSPTVSIGGRLLLDFSDINNFNLDSNAFIDTKILVRRPLNIRSWIESNRLNRSKSVMDLDLPKLNVGSGVTIDLSTSRIPFAGHWAEKLPVINLYGSFGFQGFTEPAFIKTDYTGRYSYYSDNQWEISTSFFWKADREGFNRFKMDIGAGGYDVIRVMYDQDDKVLGVKEMVTLTDPQLLLALNYTHNSSNTGYGATLRLFDNRINSMLWMKLLKLESVGEFRLECRIISPPVGRNERPWESYGGNILLLRFRTGF